MAKYASSFTGHPYYAYREKSPVPAGVVLDYTGTVLPSGFLWASGGLYLKASYPQLYARIGDTYATQVNPTTGVAYSAPAAGYFRVPDLRGVYTRGTGTSNTGVSVGLGQWLDDATAKNGLTNSSSALSGSATSSGIHSHPFSATSGLDGGHSHSIQYNSNNAYYGLTVGTANGNAISNAQHETKTPLYTNLTGAHTHSVSGTTGDSSSHTHPLSGTAAAQTITGDTETRPVTIGVNKIIKVYDVTVVAGGDSGGGPGGLVPFLINPSITSWTAEDGFSYIVAPSSTLTLNLPTGTDAFMLEVVDAGEYINNTNYVRVVPASGQDIGSAGVDNAIRMNYAKAYAGFQRADSSDHVAIKTQATTSAPPASASVEGVVKKNRYQTKILNANVTTDAATVLSFSNLTVGRTYRIKVNAGAVRGAAEGKALVFVEHNGDNLGYAGLDDFGAVSTQTDGAEGFSVNRIFTATNTSVLVKSLLVGTNATILGHATIPYTYATLEELNNYEATTAW